MGVKPAVTDAREDVALREGDSVLVEVRVEAEDCASEMGASSRKSRARKGCIGFKEAGAADLKQGGSSREG